MSRIPTDLCERLFGAMVPFYRGDIDCLFEFSGHIDTDRLERAFLAALAAEPMWSHRFVEAFWKPYWTFIPRAERDALCEIIPCGDDYTPALAELARRPVDAAARLIVFRGPKNDTVCFRVDHRLADATAARFLIDAVRANFDADVTVPEHDQPIQRRTFALLHSLVTPVQRQENLKYITAYGKQLEKLPPAFRLALPTESDPAELSPILRYPAGSMDQLTQRAMRDRCTPPLVIMAATYLAVRETVGIAAGIPLSMTSMVNLRRYLPPKDPPATASMLIGQVRLRVEEAGTTTMAAAIEQLRARMAEQRGPQLGLKFSPLSAELPRVQFLMNLLPFALMKWGLRRKFLNMKSTPDVGVSDLGEFGKPGDQWGDAILQNAYCSAGIWGVPSVSVCNSTCGSQLNIAVGASPRSFANALAAALHRRLCEYVGWSEVPARQEAAAVAAAT